MIRGKSSPNCLLNDLMSYVDEITCIRKIKLGRNHMNMVRDWGIGNFVTMVNNARIAMIKGGFKI